MLNYQNGGWFRLLLQAIYHTWWFFKLILLIVDQLRTVIIISLIADGTGIGGQSSYCKLVAILQLTCIATALTKIKHETACI